MVVDVLEAKIAIVEDDPASVALLEKILRRAGYSHISSTTDSAGALAMLDPGSVDLLLLDLHMPGIDGLEILDRLGDRLSTSHEDFLPVVVLTGDVTDEAKRKALSAGARDYIAKPFDNQEVLLRISNLLQAHFAHLHTVAQSEVLEQKVQERTADVWSALGQVEEARNELRKSQEETIERLSKAAEFRDDETSRHIQRMSRYCELLARRSGFDEQQSGMIRLASQMHDVGKIGIPDHILLKPGKLTPDERKVIETHSEIGHRILSDSSFELLQTAGLIALTHHERVDGRGYPHGLGDQEIPIEGRLAAIADVFDALTTDRVYRKAFQLQKSIAIMQEGRGTQFDAGLLDIFLDSIPEVVTLMTRFKDKEGAVGLRSKLTG